MEVYVDLLILLNFLVDFLLILGTNRLCGYPPSLKRSLAAAGVGGVYAGACVLPGFGFLAGVLWRLVSLVLMSLVAFGAEINSLRRGTLFLLLSMALGGVAHGFGTGGFVSLLLAAAGICMMCMVGFQGRVDGKRYIPVNISLGNKKISLSALVDTGNSLRDPISGRSVLVVDAEAAWKLLELDEQALLHPVETMVSGKIRGLRLIPYTSVGQQGGILLGVVADSVKLDGRQTDCVIAFAPNRLGQGRYQALAGGAL